MQSPILLLFDLGGVLIENNVFESLARLLPESVDSSTLKNRWLASAAVRQFELGDLSPEDFAELFLSEWGLPLTPDAFLREFLSWPSGFYPGAREMLRDLRNRYRVGCLSNSNVLHWEKFGGFRDDFDVALSSHRLGAIKPDDKVFVRTLAVCNVEPSGVWFFDDSLANVRAAERLGLRAFHVEGFSRVLNTLRNEGLLPC